MATSATTAFPVEAILVDLTKKYPVNVSVPGTGSESKNDFWPGQRVRLQNGQVALFLLVGSGGVSVSATCTSETTNGTTVTTSTAGAYVSMNAVSASAGEWIWVRTSALELHP